jgi:hypothetical protein
MLRATLVLVTVVGAAAAPALVSAAEEGAVDASVDVQNPSACIILGGTTNIDFGVFAFSTPSTPSNSVPNATTTVTNCSGTDVDLLARSTKAMNEAGTIQWTPVPTPDVCGAGPNTSDTAC